MKNKKENLKNTIKKKIDELIDGVDKIGNINYFEINIKSNDNELMVELKNKYKEKV